MTESSGRAVATGGRPAASADAPNATATATATADATGKLVLGLGGTVDYEIVWDSAVVEALVREYAIDRAELNATVPIDTERDLVVALLAFLERGAGGERFVATSAILEEFAARFETRITLGGTCVRAALAMQVLGVNCTLHLVSIDDHVRRLLPTGCAYISSATRDTTDPHLIVQFGEGTRVRSGAIDLQTPHANRVIFTNDPPNRELVLSEELGSVLSRAEVFMISGFNVMQDPVLLERRLRDIRRHMERLAPRAIVYYEDAGFHLPELTRPVRDALVGVVDVYSMNEEEMQAYLGRSLDLLAADEMATALTELHALIPASTLVVHTKYWSLALGASDGSAAPARWESALRGGITMASTRYRHGDGFTAREYEEMSRLPPNPLGALFAEAISGRLGSAVCCVPAIVIRVDRPTTIGLGDTFVGGFIAALARVRQG